MDVGGLNVNLLFISLRLGVIDFGRACFGLVEMVGFVELSRGLFMKMSDAGCF